MLACACCKVPRRSWPISSKGTLLIFATISAICGCSSLKVPGTAPLLIASAAGADFGMKSSATYCAPLSRLAVRSWARKPLLTSIFRKRMSASSDVTALRSIALRIAPSRSG